MSRRVQSALVLGASIVCGIILVAGVLLYATYGVVGIVVTIATLFTVMYAPLALTQPILLIRNARYVSRKARLFAGAPPVPGRRVLAVVCTNGGSPTTVQVILGSLRSYVNSLPGPLEMQVLVEERDRHTYSAPRIEVPSSFRCPQGSQHKMRALHYFSVWLLENGYGEETYVLHLDDDSVPTKGYVDYLYRMREPSGQGNVRLRMHGKHLFSTLADLVRVGDCDAWCDTFNRVGRPMAVHGEGLVIRADVEGRLGWDFGTYGADDLLMGQQLVSEGIPFDLIPHEIHIAPPTSARDFYRQRRRWIISILWARRELRALRPVAWWWALYRYIVGWTGFFGLMFVLYGFLFHPPILLPVEIVGVVNFGSYITFYQYGAWRTDRRYAWKMALCQIPVAFYEGGTLFWSLLFPPDPGVFDVIHKV